MKKLDHATTMDYSPSGKSSGLSWATAQDQAYDPPVHLIRVCTPPDSLFLALVP